MTNSRAKGARGEREWASFLTSEGFPSRRGQQFQGGRESPDVVTPILADFFHPEVKRVQRLSLYDALEQARRDAGDDQMPYVAHKKNHCQWVVVMYAEDWIRLVREYAIEYDSGLEPEREE